MDASSLLFGLLVGPTILSAFGALPGSDLYEIDVNQLAELWDREHVSPPDPYSLKHADLKQRLEAIARNQPATRVDRAGTSVEGREIYLVSLGTGPEKILLWSQMHGDEPTATSSLLDLFDFLGRRREEPWVKQMLAKYTLLAIPMLNPDGAERNQRRNAQGIDVNRDARVLQTPEGRILKGVRDKYAPILGFNLHNQNSLTTVGDSGRVATIALLAVGADKPATTGSPALSKKVTAVIYEALAPFAYGHVSRYDESYNPRAFGDNLALWGTPVVLIESGGNPAGQNPGFTVKLNFIALLAALNSLSSGKIQNANPAVFDALKSNSDTPIFDLMIRNAWIFTGSGVPLFRGDVAIRGDARADARGEAIIADLGDLGVFTAHRTIDCTGMLLTPGLIAWDPGRKFLTEDSGAQLLQRGITTVLETVPGSQLAAGLPAPDLWRSWRGAVNRAFLVEGAPPSAGQDWQFLLADWLAAGGRAWVLGSGPENPSRAMRIPRWFGREALPPEEADGFRLPGTLAGDPSGVLARWTSEAARRFRIPRRGAIAPGAAADLVLWRTPGGEAPPTDLRDCTPSQVILGGQPIMLSGTVESRAGRFID